MTSYLLEYGTHGFTPGTGTQIYTQQLSCTIPNLINGTEYDIYVWFDCNNDQQITTETPTVVSATPSNNFLMPYNGKTTITACNGIIYDNGGPNGDYASYSNDTLIIYPTSSECKVSLNGTYVTESISYDYIRIYNGAGVSGTLITTLAGSGSISSTITSTAANGALTIVFHSDGSVQKSGFAFNFSGSCSDASISGPLYFCTDSSITLIASPAASYLWTTGDTTQSISVQQTGSYQCTITDAMGCSSIVNHIVSPINDFISSINFPDMCAGNSYLITGSYETESEIEMYHTQSTLSIADTAFLPDGVPCDPYGCSYRSTLTFTDYNDDAIVESVDDIYYVKINMEHSFIGDIYINITCPNGQKADIMRWAGTGSSQCSSQIPSSSRNWQSGYNTGGGTYFGQAYDYGATDKCDRNAPSNAPGIGWNYCWSNNTSQGYTYAADGALVYRSANVHNGIVDSSNVNTGTKFYHPDQSFANLIGCPLNGSWYIEVIDGYSVDNGYIFGWELSLTDALFTNSSFDVSYITPDDIWTTVVSDSSFIISPPADLSGDTTLLYSLSFYDSEGCSFDTIVPVQVMASQPIVVWDTAYGSYEWYGETYTTSGTYTHSVTNDSGCPRTDTLHLTILNNDTLYLSATICLGSVFQEYGFDTLFTSVGTYTLSRTIHANQCDSTIVVTLTIRDSVTIATSALSICPSENFAILTAQFNPVTGNHSSVIWSAGGQNIVHTDVVTASQPQDTYTMSIPQNLCNDSLPYSITYSDGICSASTSNFVHVVDTTPPVILGNLPSLQQTGCSYNDLPIAYHLISEINSLGNISISDNCTNTNQLIITNEDDTLALACSLSYLRTYTVSDGCGNQSSFTQNILIDRPNTFTISQVNSESVVNCESQARADEITLPLVTDACGDELAPIGDPDINNSINDCTGDISYIYTYENCNGEDYSWTFTYHVQPPESFVNIPGNRTDTIPCIDDAFCFTPPTIQDICGNSISASILDTLTSMIDGNITIVYRFTYTDCAGRDSIWTHTLYVVPNTFTPPQNGEEEVHCISQIEDPVLPEIINCGEPITLIADSNTSTIVNGCGDTTFVYHYSVNETLYTWHYTYHVIPDNFNPPTDITLMVQCLNEITVPDPPVVLNSCLDTITPIMQPVDSVYNGCSGQVIYSWLYADCAQHQHIWTCTYIIDDTTSPSFVVPDNISLCRNAIGEYEADSSITGAPTFLSDNCVPIHDLTISHFDNFTTHLTIQDTIIRTWTVSDGCNSRSQLQYIFINPSVLVELSDTVCAGEILDTLGFQITAVHDTLLIHTAPSANTGCDSITTLALSVLQPTFFTDTYDTCSNFTWIDGVTYTESNNTATYMLTNAVGCDSIVSLHLTIGHTNYGDTTAFACDRFDWYEHGNITASGEFSHTFTNASSCDSVVTLHFTYLDPATNIISMTYNFCDDGSAVLMVESNLENYVWSTGETTPTITVYEEGLYTVTATQGVCEREASFTIQPCEHEILLPNAISPNGAVENHFFRIPDSHLKLISDYDFSVYIYNRLGTLVFSSTSKYFQWDGTVNGNIHHEAIYNYVIYYRNKSELPRKLTGSVLVL